MCVASKLFTVLTVGYCVLCCTVRYCEFVTVCVASKLFTVLTEGYCVLCTVLYCQML